ncbi:YtrH family sporulation protein [Fictibacillus gelatini]|uniref:YtrH family sporulation protein n=1 Tax=Fictibacillus gelatini TaxID=225985 RepID=UPI000407E06E|nr:YtrH family sporulation protein [Fictibacillus gelatini]
MEESIANYVAKVVISFFTSFGVILGGAIIGGLAAFLVGKAPILETVKIADQLKIWAIVSAIGGTFDTFNLFERNFFHGVSTEIIKQIIIILVAMAGANTATLLIKWLTQESLNL